ncbi:CTP synthase [Candidatus Epulonipiscium viviparus]|uniref:CTP synthase n=1 Tax=Candidatus Epulonipiscium viviparus TaxID=420336 RepID=UPI00016C044E|nr:CTP synthase [Candidatus Epulopiscium viviparus]
MSKFIFVTGGVVSGLGKGITAASLGRLLKARGLKVSAQKLDPYMNVDPGTMSPYQHGEVFVTEDGAETDLDLGHYERFIDENLNKFSNLTSGKIYYEVLTKERSGGYLGQTVQVIPHITNVIKDFIYNSAKNTDVLITEIGGTTGDIEIQPFLETIRQISLEVGRDNCVFIHLTLVPYIKSSGEHKSKPTQHSVKELQAMGISPDIIVARADEELSADIMAKISLFCNVKKDCVIENITLPSLYEAPLMLHKNGLDKVVCRTLKLETVAPDLTEWKEMVDHIYNSSKDVNIAIVGKYVKLHDAYLSVAESLRHAGYMLGAKVSISWIDSEEVTAKNISAMLSGVDGIVVPGGFGDRGIEGKILTCKYARENDIPLLGICLGMQVAVVEFARNVLGLADANSAEFSETTQNPVIHIMQEQKTITDKGGTMRLGSYLCSIKDGTLLKELYGKDEIAERHRHRYEFNNDYREQMISNGLVISGVSPDKTLVEVIEIPTLSYYIAVQFHPEFKSRPNKPHPLFSGLIQASIQK